ncbi:protein ALP1-like [Salvia divinorum]|uniref:Protein ALP1-like n=1 Tax=Salvia divinorum TaxID=28513 RepID=A0ABD1I769_SALDI
MYPDDDLSTNDCQNRSMERIMFTLADSILASIRAQQEQVPRPILRRTYVRREHDVAYQRLFEDYFAEEP